MTMTTEPKSATTLPTSLAPTTKSRSYKVASIPADGISPEVVSAAIEVVQKLAQISKTFTIEFEHIPWGTAYYKEHGKYVDDGVLEVLRRYDAVLFGSVGAPGKFLSADEVSDTHI